VEIWKVALKQQGKKIAASDRILIFFTYTYKNPNPICLSGKRRWTANSAANRVET